VEVKNPVRLLKNDSGVAMLIAAFTLALITFIAMEVSFLTQIEHASSAGKVNKLKAKYAAKAGVEISLLRVLLYKKASVLVQNAKNQNPDLPIPVNQQMLDIIWTFPFSWPPIGMLGEDTEDASAITKDELQSIQKESSFDAVYSTIIESEGGRIDINALASPSEKLKESVHQQLLSIFTEKLETDDDFADKYSVEDFENVINAMTDWVDENTQKVGTSSEESNDYTDYNIESELLPPNAPFKTKKEIRLVKGMDDELYNLIKDRVTVFGIRGIQVNYADLETLMSIDDQITLEIGKEIITRRNDLEQGGPFADEDSFFSYVGTLGVNKDDFNTYNIPLLFDPVYNFRISSIGEYQGTTKEIIAITYDADSLKSHYATLLDKEAEEERVPDQPDSTQGDQQETADTKKEKPALISIPSKRPDIVYWTEI